MKNIRSLLCVLCASALKEKCRGAEVAEVAEKKYENSSVMQIRVTLIASDQYPIFGSRNAVCRFSCGEFAQPS